MKRCMRHTLAAVLLGVMSFSAQSQDVLIRNATVHTATAQGTLQATDVWVSGGKVQAIGSGLQAPANVTVVQADGRPLTPTLFGGITGIGVEEISGESDTVDVSLALAETGAMSVRPEFDVTLAYNPQSLLVPVARVEGIGWTLLGARATRGGSIIGGQGGVVRLDGSADPIGPRALFAAIGGPRAAGLSGQSRAAQWMLLDQWVSEVRDGKQPSASPGMLTAAGRATLARYLDGGGRVVVEVNRAADIRQLLRWSARHGVRIAISGGAEAWQLAPQLAAAKVPVFVDPLANLPADFDQLGASMENAARLHAAGVAVGFSQAGDAAHNARKIRQLAGNAVAAGLPWQAALAGLTTVPAEAFGVAAEVGQIRVGQRADLVLWSGDPLEVNALATQVWLDGRAIPMRSRQTELRDRYLRPESGWPRAYPAPAADSAGSP